MTKKEQYWLIGLGAATLLLGGLVVAYRKEIKKFLFGCSDSFLFIGDSTSAGSFSYADKFMKKCTNAKNKKIAKSGAKTSWMLEELQKELKNNKYDVITILGGSNDIFGTLSIDKAKQNMDEMFRLAKENGAKVISISPPSKKFSSSATQKHWKLIAEWEKYLKNHPIPTAYIPLSEIVVEQNQFASDNQHINDKGHQKLFDAFLKQINMA